MTAINQIIFTFLELAFVNTYTFISTLALDLITLFLFPV